MQFKEQGHGEQKALEKYGIITHINIHIMEAIRWKGEKRT